MGLVGYGKYEEYYYNVFELIIEGCVQMNFAQEIDLCDADWRRKYLGCGAAASRINLDKINLEYGIENLAFTLQKFTLDKIREYIFPLKTSDNFCIVESFRDSANSEEDIMLYICSFFMMYNR